MALPAVFDADLAPFDPKCLPRGHALRQHLSRAVSTESLLRSRLTPPVAPVRERRSV